LQITRDVAEIHALRPQAMQREVRGIEPVGGLAPAFGLARLALAEGRLPADGEDILRPLLGLCGSDEAEDGKEGGSEEAHELPLGHSKRTGEEWRVAGRRARRRPGFCYSVMR